MLVALTITLELSDDVKNWSNAEVRQFLYDEYVNYVSIKHNEDALEFRMKADQNCDEELASVASIAHTNMSEDFRPMQWSFSKL